MSHRKTHEIISIITYNETISIITYNDSSYKISTANASNPNINLPYFIKGINYKIINCGSS